MDEPIVVDDRVKTFDVQAYFERQKLAAQMGGKARKLKLSPRRLKAIARKGGMANARKWRLKRQQQRVAELAASFGSG